MKGKWHKRIRQLHALLAPIVLLPLLVTVITGVAYRLGKSWFGLSREQVHFLMVIHEGEYLGRFFEPIYVLLNGLGLLWMLVTGTMILLNSWINSRKVSPSLGNLSPQTPEKEKNS
ncbi:MAG: PepSY domain-containing protein [Geminocystis sp.]|nr:PepSY domain-containing protein [Geminocystis sp.]MCS7146788.1 PepSY domain-containing protein [Geminocystis sp.]MCX8077062.1 PepSY domain-containing protein [Geminocystis sp.]MDW8115614.1 PepSY domain-containing protein [Geminocystis sp.]MDW8463156.1 PepSY domain-containing protein [Geminocystis sp.]